MKERGNRVLRYLDRYAGIPIVWLLGMVRRRRTVDVLAMMGTAPRIALLKTAAIGDTVLISAMLKELRHAFPQAHITLVVSKANASLTSLLPGVDRMVLFDMSSPLRSLKEMAMLQKYHLLLDFSPWTRIDSLIAYSVPADWKMGFKRRGTYRHYIFDAAVEHTDHLHEIDNYRNLLRAIPIRPKGYLPALTIDDALVRKLDGLLKGNGRDVVLHPFAGGYRKELKEWSTAKWTETAKALIRRGYRICITGAKDDKEGGEEIKNGLGELGDHCLVLCGQYSLAETAAIISRSRLLISVNTGMMHMGAALSVPLVALHGPTSPERWGPASASAVVIRPNIPCAPCISLGHEYPCSSGGCMDSISVDEVVGAADRILSLGSAPPKP